MPHHRVLSIALLLSIILTISALSADVPPVVVPGSVVWSPNNVITPDDVDAKSVTLKIMTGSGWQEVTRCALDLSSLGYTGLRDAVLSRDESDPTGRTAVATVSDIRAKPGARCSTSYGQPPHYLRVRILAWSYWTGDDTAVQAQVSGQTVAVNVRHRRVDGWRFEGAQPKAVGGGIPGIPYSGPFTYYAAPADANGDTTIELSAGSFRISYARTGFASEPAQTIQLPYAGPPLTFYLRPYAIAELLYSPNIPKGTKVNVEGVCYAQPAGYYGQPNGTLSAYGLAPRTDTGVLRNQWYVCDPNAPSYGMLFMVTTKSASFAYHWDDSDLDWIDPDYIGKRPAVGETIMITGVFDEPDGCERRVLIDDADISAAMTASPSTISHVYLNRGDLGGLPRLPNDLSLAGLMNDQQDETRWLWGQYMRVYPATVVRICADGSGNPVPYVVIADDSGHYGEVVLDNPDTLGMSSWLENGFAPDLGATCWVRGAAGISSSTGNICIRVRGYDDFHTFLPFPGSPSPISTARTVSADSTVNVSGIVTAKMYGCIWIESPDRSAGIRVQWDWPYVSVGDEVQVVGTVLTWGLERMIQPTRGVIVLSAGNTVPPPFEVRTKDIRIAQHAYDEELNAPGAVNDGLLVHLQGMVTAVDTDSYPDWYCIWDGANRGDQPVRSGNCIGIVIESAPPAGIVPWRDWMEVSGVVGIDDFGPVGAFGPGIFPVSQNKVTAFDTITAPAGTALAEGWNLIGLPAAPAGMGDGDEFSAKPWEPYMVLAPSRDPGEIDGRIYRWDNCIGSLDIYDMWSEAMWHGPFAGLLTGDGYWLNLDEDWAVSYSGKRNDLDQWIACCEGWMLLGHPKDHGTLLTDVKVHDGQAIWSMRDAVLTNGWIDCTGYWWDNVTQGLVDIGIPDCWATSDTLLPWHGYWIQTYRSQMSLIIPESPAAH